MSSGVCIHFVRTSDSVSFVFILFFFFLHTVPAVVHTVKNNSLSESDVAEKWAFWKVLVVIINPAASLYGCFTSTKKQLVHKMTTNRVFYFSVPLGLTGTCRTHRWDQIAAEKHFIIWTIFVPSSASRIPTTPKHKQVHTTTTSAAVYFTQSHVGSFASLRVYGFIFASVWVCMLALGWILYILYYKMTLYCISISRFICLLCMPLTFSSSCVLHLVLHVSPPLL